MKVLVTGKKGQLGSELKKISSIYDFNWFFTDRQSFDISDIDNINVFFLAATTWRMSQCHVAKKCSHAL